MEPQIPKEQAGFVKGRGTREQILNMRQLIEKAREYNVEMILCFVDYKKAFDCVDWKKLWLILLEMGAPIHLVTLIKNLYDNGYSTVRLNSEVASNEFQTGRGVRQGCILSPLLFNLYGEYIMRKVLENDDPEEAWNGGVIIGGHKLTNLRYADDTTLLAACIEEMENLLNKLEAGSRTFGLEINRSKTKMMIIDRPRNNRPDVAEIAGVEVVTHFTYLGSEIDNNGGCEKEVNRRVQMARNAMVKLNKIWRDRAITKRTKIRLVRTLVFSIFLYGAETWAVRQKERKKIDSFEMWCWRRMLRIPWTAKRTNQSILSEIGEERRLSSEVYARILKYFGHVTRANTLESIVVQGKVDGKRSRGRSPTRWSDLIRTLTDRTFVECTRLARDRDRWRNLVYAVTESRGHDAPAGGGTSH